MRIVAAVWMLLAAHPAHAGIERAGTTTANFLQVGAGGAALGMAGAGIGLIGTDLAGFTVNPATLSSLRGTQLAFSHFGLAEQSAQEWAGVGGALRTLPLRWALSGLYQGDGTFEGRDALGNPTGDFDASSLALALNGAWAVREHLRVGLGMKYVTEALGDVRGSGLAFDLGAHAAFGRYGVGAALVNTGGRMRYDGIAYPFAASLGLGASMTDPGTGLKAAVDLVIPNAYYTDVRAGLEWAWQDRLALRAGYRYEVGAGEGEPMTGPAFGMGAGMNGFWLDYALVMYGPTGDGQHRVGLNYHPAAINAGAAPQAAPRRAAETAKPPRKAAAVKPKTKARRNAVPDGTLALDTAPPRPDETQKKETPRSLPAAVKRAQIPAPPPAKARAIPVTTLPKPAPKPELVKPEPAPAEPATAAPAKASPATVAPAPVEPAQAAPAKVEPAPAAPAKVAPAPAAPAQVAPAPVEPAKAAPAKVAPAQVVPAPAAPARVEPAKAEPAPVEPAKAESAPVEAAKAQPAKVEPAKVEPAKAEPAKVELAKVEPAKAEPAKVEPAKVEPAKVETPAAKPARSGPRPAHVVVKKDQSLADIAAEWETSVAALMMENNLITQKAPKPGTRLKLPPRTR